MSTTFGFFCFFLSARSIVDNFLKVSALSKTSFFKKRPVIDSTNLSKTKTRKESLEHRFETSTKILAGVLPKQQKKQKLEFFFHSSQF